MSLPIPVPRLLLAHLPTPLTRIERLGLAMSRLGHPDVFTERRIEVFAKRDDMTGGVDAGNKIRKLEFLVADAMERGADTLLTCGGIQSNHARATAAVAARMGLGSVVFLRASPDESDPSAPIVGNHFLDRLLGAEVRFITAAQYRERNAIMRDAAAELSRAGRRPYVIPEGGSNGLGALGYVEAMREVKQQIDHPFDAVVFACGSGGTAAGIALGASAFEVASEVIPMVVSDDRRTFEEIISRIVAETRALVPELGEPATLTVDDGSKGPAYGVATEPQKKLVTEVARATGLVLDPVYTGKAFDGLVRLALDGSLDAKRVLFVHTGGLPGLLAQASSLAPIVR